jgi:CubicO group peptidase (beta-lactamase class C family)
MSLFTATWRGDIVAVAKPLRARKAVKKMNFVGWHGQTLASHLSLTSQYQAQGYGFVTLSVYGSTTSPCYAAVMIQPAPATQHEYATIAGNAWQQTFDSEAAQGYGPAIIAATGPASGPLFAAVFEPQSPIPLTRNGLPSGPDPWNLQQINNGGVTNGPSAVSNLFVCVYNNEQHFAYLDGSGNIQDAWFGNGSWSLQQINNGGMTQGPLAAGNLFVCDYNDQQHFAYLDKSGNIQDAWWGNGWNLQKINNGGMTSGPSATSNLFVCVFNNQQHFSYLDKDGNIQDAWYDPSGWHLQKINDGGMTAGPKAAGNLFVCVYNDEQHFAYLDSSGNIQDAWYDSSGWHLQKINNGGMTSGPSATGNLFVSVYNDQQHFAYLDSSGNIQDAWWGNGWNLQKINNGGVTNGPPAAGNLFVSVYGNQQHFSYLDKGGNIQDAWYDGAGWNFETINVTGVTGGPAAASGLFVCPYINNENHFSYIDSGGNIQDAWYNGGPITIQAMVGQARRQGLILRWAASYGDSSNPAFAAVWVPNAGQTLWNNDGVLDSAGTYQGRFDAEFSGWCRPAFVTLNTSGQYLSQFVDNQVGPWYADHVMTPAEYQTAFDTRKAQGYYPVCVQAAGADAASATISAIFVQSQNIVAKSFNATGPVANTKIDDIIKMWMATYGSRHAGLAIVHGTTLVYARGYTLAEPGWPLAQPTTCFRLASVSKTVTALVIYQLIQDGLLQTTDTLQGILGLQTPTGGTPSDPRFSQITIQQLLEHTSGLNPGAMDDALGVQQAFINAGHPNSLPVSAAMTDSYIASLPLVTSPGATQVYNNCGYYFLARVIGKLRNAPLPIDAYQQYFFNPLSITRIRRGVSLVANQPPDEARYQNYDLPVYTSVMSDAQPLVPDVYGNVQLEINEGAGGLSAGPTDLARLIAILISQKDNPSVTRSTLGSMLKAGAHMTASGFNRAGYGFDSVSNLGGGQFYAQKGGLLGSSSSVLQFNGDWGFTMLWGSGEPGSLPNQPWYPDFPQVMNIATKTNWGPGDLFPQFGMPSL